MKAPENIDEILQKGFESFNPTPPPDVWAHIEQNLGQASVGSTPENLSNASKAVNAIKSASMLTKVALFSLIPAATVIYMVSINTSHHTLPPEITVSKAKVYEPETASNNNGSANTPAAQNESTKVYEYQKSTHKQAISQKNAYVEDANSNSANILNETNKVITALPLPAASAPKEEKSNIVAKIITKADIKEKQDESVSKTPAIEVEKKEDPKELVADEPKFFNAISPNGDGSNDRFEIENIKNAVLYHLVIYDKTGNLVFESNQAGNTWNGTNFKTGEECLAGTYSFIFNYQMNSVQAIHTKSGIFDLIR